jgi:hypothetical protein
MPQSRISRMSVYFCETTRRYIPEGCRLHHRSRRHHHHHYHQFLLLLSGA